MNLIAGAPTWLIALLIVALIAAAIEDAARLRISNITSLIVIGGAVCAAVLEGPSISLWQNVAVFCIVLVLGTAAFSAGLLGGADVKLLAASAIWVDFRTAVWLFASVFVAGGVLGAAYLASRPFRKHKKARVPYGIAIALGVMVVTAMSRGWLQHHPRPLPPIKMIRPSA